MIYLSINYREKKKTLKRNKWGDLATWWICNQEKINEFMLEEWGIMEKPRRRRRRRRRGGRHRQHGGGAMGDQQRGRRSRQHWQAQSSCIGQVQFTCQNG